MAAWRGASPLTDFVQRELREGEPITERTEVRVLTDAEALYVGAWLFDRDWRMLATLGEYGSWSGVLRLTKP